MNPVEFAKGLKSKHGSGDALRIAENMVALTATLASDTLAVPALSDEMEMSQGDDGKERIKVDEQAKSKRVKGTAVFWQNVLGNLRGRTKVKVSDEKPTA